MSNPYPYDERLINAQKEIAAVGMVDLWDDCRRASKEQLPLEATFGHLFDKLIQIAVINNTPRSHIEMELDAVLTNWKDER